MEITALVKYPLLLAVMAIIVSPAVNAFADMPAPDSPPTIIDEIVYQNVLKPGDMLVLALENTPYASPPTVAYSSAYSWRLQTVSDTDIATATGCAFHSNGYGYNVISFYLDPTMAPAWGVPYNLRLSGSPSIFASPPLYNFDLPVTAYSSLTDTTAVKTAISSQILEWAKSLDTYWALTPDLYLETQSNTGTTLSVYGEDFFRNAIYGLQSMAPAAFQMIITNFDTSSRTWATTYADLLAHEYAGTYLEPAMQAANNYLNVGYNMAGLLVVFVFFLALVVGHWTTSGGPLWKGMVEMAPILVIFARLSVIGMPETCFVAALCWIYDSAKTWRMI